MSKPDKVHREQAADLLLLDGEGNHLVFTSTIDTNPDGSMSFTVGEEDADGVAYRITLKIEEV